MEIYDKNNKLLDANTLDFSKGRIVKTSSIKPDAKPIDNITKFAWEDTDYEEIQVFTPYTPEELKEMNKPSELELLQTDINEIKQGIGAIMNILSGGMKT